MRPHNSSATFFRGIISVAVLLFILVFSGSSLSAQTCTASATTPTVHAEGYAEQVGDVTFSCTGGTTGSAVSMSLYVGLNVNITNRLDGNGNPTGISVNTSPGVFAGAVSAYSAVTVAVAPVSYTVSASPSTPVTVTVSGIRAAAATLANGTSTIPLIQANVLALGVNFTAPSSGTILVASLAPTLLSSSINNGIPCLGSPVPATIDFPTFVSSNTSVSAIRVTEASPAAFVKKTANADTGVRILVKLSGYTLGAGVYVPDAIVGNDPGASATSGGLYGVSAQAGSYTPGNSQLLLIRINGADATGTGGTFAVPVPLAPYNLSSVSQLTLTSGSTYAVYEVADGNPNIVESAQIPIWVTTPATACTGVSATPTFSATIAPVSTVSIATATDPIPRFMAAAPGNDCTLIGDCSANYFPTLSVSTSPITFSSNSLGAPQQITFNVTNSGSGLLNYTLAVTYGSGAGWLTVTPTSGQNTTVISVTASPAALAPGTYIATITVTAGSQTAQIPITFNVGPVGVTIQNVGNAASFQYGTVAPGSYAVIFGMNLTGVSTTSVTFNAVPAQIVYSSPAQINVIVPSNLTNTQASVVVTADGAPSNPFRVTLANAPGIFGNGILNFADGQTNTAADPVTRGNFAIVYLTGLIMPLTGPVTVNIGNQTGLMPSYAGPQGTYPSENQVNITVPLSLPASPNPVPLQVCVGPTGQTVCSNSVNLYIQ